MNLFEEEENHVEQTITASKKQENEIDSAYESNLKNSLWVEKYRPRRLSEYVGDEKFKERIRRHIESGDIPHILLYGPAGTGKTSVSKMIAGSLNCDLLYINASSENSVDTVREKIGEFASSVGFNDLKIVILDEMDYLSQSGQAALRATLEIYSGHTRFIMTCNYHEKIMGAIISRCQVEKVIPPNKAHIAKHLASILNKEGVSFELKGIATIINAHYPDIRKIIGMAQQFSKVDNILKLDEEKIVDGNIHLKIVEILKLKPDPETASVEIRQIIADSGIYNFDTHYKYLFDTVDSWAKGNTCECIIILSEMQHNSTNVPDREINFASCIMQILKVIGEK